MSFPYRRLPLLSALVVIAVLGACRDREPEQPDSGNGSIMTEPVAPDAAPNAALPAPAPQEETQNVQAASPPAPPPDISDDQQVLDDAAAVGMTARRRGAETTSPDAKPVASRDELAEGNGQALDPIY